MTREKKVLIIHHKGYIDNILYDMGQEGSQRLS